MLFPRRTFTAFRAAVWYGVTDPLSAIELVEPDLKPKPLLKAYHLDDVLLGAAETADGTSEVSDVASDVASDGTKSILMDKVLVTTANIDRLDTPKSILMDKVLPDSANVQVTDVASDGAESILMDKVLSDSANATDKGVPGGIKTARAREILAKHNGSVADALAEIRANDIDISPRTLRRAATVHKATTAPLPILRGLEDYIIDGVQPAVTATNGRVPTPR